MADLTQEQLTAALNAQAETLARLMKAGSGSGKDFVSSLNFSARDANKSLKDLRDRLVDSSIKLKNVSVAGNLAANVMGRSSKDFEKSTSKMASAINDIDRALDEYEDTLSKSEKDRLQNDRKYFQHQLDNAHMVDSATKAASSGLASFGKSVVTTMTGTMAGIAQTIQSGGSGFAIAGQMMEAQIDMTNAANQGMASAASTVGGTLMNSTNKGAKIAGAGMMVLGSVAGIASEALSTLAKAGVRIMMAEGEKVINTYKNLTSAGVVFGDGIRDMQAATAGTKLRLEDMAEAVTNNREAFAKSGLGMAEATKRVGGIARSMASSGIDKELMALGYTYKEQAGMAADTLAYMRKSKGGENVTNSQAAEATKKYAENLSLIASLTGEDIKAKQAKIADENANLAMEAKIAEMTPEQANKFRSALAGMTDTQRKAMRDQMIFGTIRDKDAAQLMASNSGFRKSVEDMSASQRRGTLDGEEALKINNKHSKEMRDQALEQGKTVGAAAVAGSDAASGLAKSQYEMSQAGIQYAGSLEEAKKKQQEITDKAKEPGAGSKDPTKAMFEAIETGAVLAKHLQDKVIDNLSEMPKLMNKYYAEIESLIDKMSDGGKGALGWMEKIMEWLPVIATLLPLLFSAIGFLKGKGLSSIGKGGPGGGGTTPGTPSKGPGGMTPEEHAKYKEHRAAGMTATDAKAAATKPTGIKGLAEAEKGLGKSAAASAAEAVPAAAGKGVMKSMAKKIPVVGALLGLGMLASDVHAAETDKSLTTNEKRAAEGSAVGSAAGAAGGAWGGAAAGAAIGTLIFPGVGTAIGGLIGGIAGGVGGDMAGSWLGKKVGGLFGKDEPNKNIVKAIPAMAVDPKLANNWAWSVFSGKVDPKAVPAAYATEVSKILQSPPGHWAAAAGKAPTAGGVAGSGVTGGVTSATALAAGYASPAQQMADMQQKMMSEVGSSSGSGAKVKATAEDLLAEQNKLLAEQNKLSSAQYKMMMTKFDGLISLQGDMSDSARKQLRASL